MRRQTITVEFPDDFAPYTAGGFFRSAKVVEAEPDVHAPERDRYTIVIEIDRYEAPHEAMSAAGVEGRVTDALTARGTTNLFGFGIAWDRHPSVNVTRTSL